jgi:hypothetical protein
MLNHINSFSVLLIFFGGTSSEAGIFRLQDRSSDFSRIQRFPHKMLGYQPFSSISPTSPWKIIRHPIVKFNLKPSFGLGLLAFARLFWPYKKVGNWYNRIK